VQILAAEKEKRSRIAADPKPGAWDIAAEFMFCVVKPGE
jgi:hypothetical protein